MPGARVLGPCYVCGKPVWGRRAIVLGFDGLGNTNDRKGVAIRDVNGLRHGGVCKPFPTRGAVTPSDA